MKEGETALFLAAKNGHHEVAQILLDSGADVNVQNGVLCFSFFLEKKIIFFFGGRIFCLVFEIFLKKIQEIFIYSLSSFFQE